MNISDDRLALDLLNKSLRIGRQNWQAYANIGFILFKAASDQAAEKALEKAIAAAAGDLEPDLLNMYGRVLFALDRPDEAIRAFRRGMAIGATPELNLNLVAAYIKSGDIPQARRQLLRMADAADDPVYLLYRASLFAGVDRQMSLDRVASLLFAQRADLCAWLEEIHGNRQPGIIYPDLSDIEEDLRRSYTSLAIAMRDEIVQRSSKAEMCAGPATEAAGVQ